ncbi:bromodomain-containing protein 8 isoform X3 [Rhinichthys klamathensis goyatoka]|uniref:bromodomain-containing protein 8 isoform X3 n=1 Tax=Rhinichthys klamathensis goyatoka TaxID=3034132 RepID=UPI0024B595D0|nr:bromodomain-containing protein 8 isoform X3 [Rhinichthys klamathensis goyatoka]
MSSGVGKHKMLSLGPTEPWSIREKLCLASSVMRSGDQNWVSVSRAIKPFSESGRPPDWFSQKHCASQYSELLETTEAPKRKRGEKGEVVETIEDVIVRRLTAERIEELKRLIKDTQEKYRKLKKEVDLIQAGHMDTKLEELWAEIELKKKQEEEEAEQKKRATEAAYQVRQAAKNTPKRVPSVTVRSPPGASSPSMEVSQPDTSQPMTEESCAGSMTQGVTVFMPVSEVTGSGPKESGLGALVDDSPQKKHLAPKATPPPSPLLSELLKKGSLIAASSRLVVEGDVATGLSNGSHVELHTSATALPMNQDITADAPTLSRLLESSTPAQKPVSADPPKSPKVVPPTPGHLSVPKTGAAAVAEGSGAEAVMAGSSTPAEVEGKETELVEEDTVVSVSYMAHELDLETVGDIIAIIEEKVDDPVEALDAAAVEAALSLCEDPAVGGHPLTSPWESQSFKADEPEPIVQQSTAPAVTQSAPDPADVQGEMEVLVEEATETEAVDGVTGEAVTPVAPDAGQSQDSEVKIEREGEGEGGMEEMQQEIRSPSPAVKCEVEDWVQPETVTPCLDSEDSSASAKDTKEVKEEDGGSDVDEGMEMKECGDVDGEGAYLSEVDPPASESEDGYGSHSQRYTTADSTASSPASSQFSMCSEDQEALQAQKIWKKAIMLVWRAAANHRYASVFLQPVSDDIAPGYHSIVHRPMDLSAIKKNIESGQIRTTAEFQRDIMLMFQNAVMYNSSDHDVYHMALEMQRDVLEQIQQFLATQLIMQTSESGISTKSLRGREANRKQDPNEKDSLSMASPAFLLSLFDGGTRGRRSAIEADMKMKK